MRMLMSLNEDCKSDDLSHLNRLVESVSNQFAIVANTAATIAKGIGADVYNQKARRNPANDTETRKTRLLATKNLSDSNRE